MVVENHFSDYIVYVDESGDHSMAAVNSNYPIFVLAFCIFRKDGYIDEVVPAIQSLKFKYWGHDMIVLHESELRKPRGEFTNLLNKDVRESFFSDFNQLISAAPFTIIACSIDKRRLTSKYTSPPNLYHIALEACLLKLNEFFIKQDQQGKIVHVAVEKRGKREDNELELEFRRICDAKHGLRQPLPFVSKFASKDVNSCGLQLADMVARPIGRRHLDRMQLNRAYDILRAKFYGYSALTSGAPDGLIYYE